LTPPEYGTPFKAIGFPLFDENNTWIGSLGFGISLQQEYLLNDIIANLNNIAATIGDQTHTITAHAEELSATIQEISASAAITMKHTEEMDNVITFIKDVAQQSNLLGLNAAIEAARAGENGRTFSVVATEIRNLSHHTEDASKKIGTFLGEMKGQIIGVTNSIGDIEQSSNELTANAEMFTKLTEDLNQLSQTLNSFISALLKEK
jgi:methyl-accepting chemotaxis protein